MPTGVAFSLVAYLLYSCCDAIIKGFGSSLSVFEIAFWTALFSFVPAMLTKPQGRALAAGAQDAPPLAGAAAHRPPA